MIRAIEHPEGWRRSLAASAMVLTNYEWQPYDYLMWMCQIIEDAIIQGNARIMVSMPPRHGKSMTISRVLPVWFHENWPERESILATYSNTFAESWGRKVLHQFQRNPLLTAQLGEKQSASEMEFAAGGALVTAGTGGGITGRGGDLIVCDDLIKDWEEARSVAAKRKLRDWFGSTLMTRLSANGSVIIVMTRWAPDDLIGYLLADDEDNDWIYFALPALAEENDMLGRQPGEALCPERYSVKKLEQRRKEIGSFKFTGMYQQRPQKIGGSIVKSAWLQKYYRVAPKFEKVINSWDLSMGGVLENNSFVSGQAWGCVGADRYLIMEFHERCTPGRQYKAIEDMAHITNPRKIIIEDKALSRGAYDALHTKLSGIILVNPKGSKVERLEAASVHAESGNVYLPDPKDNPWVNAYRDELTQAAGEGTLMDRADSFSLAINYLNKKKKKLRYGSCSAPKKKEN